MGDSIHMLVRCSPGPKLLGARLTIKAWGPVVSSIHVVLTVILIPEGKLYRSHNNTSGDDCEDQGDQEEQGAVGLSYGFSVYP